MALQANSSMILALTFFIFVLPFAARRESSPSRRVLRIICSLQTLSLLISMLPIMGWVEAIEWTLHATIIHGLISGSLMFLVLHLRSRQLKREGQQAKLELVLSDQHLQLERSRTEEQSRFMAMLNHELKTPLSVMRMVVGTPAPTQELLVHADLAVRDMNNVIERCLQAEKLTDRQLAANLVDCKLHEELEQLRRNSPAPERLLIDTKIFLMLKTDVQMLRIILANLIDNAMKYSPPESHIQIQVAPEHQGHGEGISIVVQNLPGLAGWPDPDKIFQKYYRSTAAHHQIGTGLGLYLIENIARQLGGRVDYVPDNLTVRFKLWLPT
jgi:signal transduction histidine kinase